MLRALGSCLMIMAILVAMNVHWALIQGYAWATMLQEEQQRASTIREAIENTFGGEHPCELCTLVAINLEEPGILKFAREASWQQLKLLPLTVEPVQIVVNAEASRLSAPQDKGNNVTHPPETPPPRAA
ncbi:MAG: hypothetical protein AAGF10_04250 [Verrucomicrobiota bacterium]